MPGFFFIDACGEPYIRLLGLLGLSGVLGKFGFTHDHVLALSRNQAERAKETFLELGHLIRSP